jgi:hypothetical protein
VAEIAPYIVAIVNRIKEAIKEAGGFEAIWGKIKAVAHSVINILTIIGTILAARLVVGAAAFVFQLGKALIAARGISTVLARTPVGLLSAGFAYIADKVGIDLVGGLGEALDLNLDIDAAQQQINDALAEKNQKLNESIDLQDQYNEDQRKILTALDDTIIKQEIQIANLRDILAFGEKEAAIRKAVADEQQKLLKGNIKLSDEEVAARLKVFEANERNKVSLTNQVQAQKEMLTTMGELVYSSSSFAKQLNALRDLELNIKGMDKEDIANMDRERIRSDKALQDFALKLQEERIQQEISAEFGKYNELIGAEQKYLKDRAALKEIERAYNEDRIKLSLEQEDQLFASFLALEAQYQADRIKAVQAANERIYQIELTRIQNQLQAEKNGIAQALSTKDQEILQRRGAEERQKAIAQDRIEFEKKSDLDKTQFALTNMQTVFSALGAQNKKAFEASKALAIASALVNTYQGATKALATYPFPFGLIAAAAAVAAGMAQVAAIRSQQYQGRALGGPVMGGQSYIVGESGPELFTPSATGSITRNSDLGGGSPVNVNFTIIANDTQGFDQLLTSRQGVIKQIISDAMLERGSRSIV